jgi:hypothetical protein
MLPIVIRFCSAYKQKMDYKGLNDAIGVTLGIYHRSGK